VPYLSFFLFLTTMTTVNNEIATANSDIQSAVLIYSQFLGKRSGDSKLCRIVSQANEAALPASIVCLSRHLYRKNDQIHTRTITITELRPVRQPSGNARSATSVHGFVRRFYDAASPVPSPRLAMADYTTSGTGESMASLNSFPRSGITFKVLIAKIEQEVSQVVCGQF
jgi:hypothetical protein